MRVLSVVGPGATEVAERLVSRLDGRVATVERLQSASERTPATANASYGLATDGSWVGAGEGRSLDGVLDELTPAYDYTLVVDFSDARLPTVAIGDHDTRGPVVHHAATVADVDLDTVAHAVADVDPRVTLDSLVRRVKASPRADRAGAIATFTGRVRTRDSDDDAPTTQLEFETYEGVAEEAMSTISSELTDRDGVYDVLLHHRTGVIEDGEDIVFVVVLAGHRTEAFRTVEDGINRLKDEVPIFKKETTVDEEFWVHDRA